MDDKVTLQFPGKDIKCNNCKFAIGEPGDYHCAKFKFKPQEVLFDNKDCPEFKEEN